MPAPDAQISWSISAANKIWVYDPLGPADRPKTVRARRPAKPRALEAEEAVLQCEEALDRHAQARDLAGRRARAAFGRSAGSSGS